VTNGERTRVATLIVLPLIIGGVVGGVGEDVAIGVGWGWAITGARFTALLTKTIVSAAIAIVAIILSLRDHRW
jgi:hypothetical protein